jgi:signal transduction histidine kinase/HAMP domain-containing protein
MTSNSFSFPVPSRVRSLFRSLGDLPLRIKIILVFPIMIFLTVAAISLFNTRGIRIALTDQTGKGLAALAVSEANSIADVLVKRVSAMQAFSLRGYTQEEVMTQNATYSDGTQVILPMLIDLDEQWIAASDDDALVQERMSSELALELKTLTLVMPDFVEAFVTDRYGGLVATSHRTSDYYQADEEWWQSAYNDGEGSVYIGPPEFDESTGVVGVNVAVPLYSPSNGIVGIMRTTLNVTALLDRLASVELGETGGAALLVRDKLFEAREAHRVDEHEWLDSATLIQLDRATEGYVEANLAGNLSLIGYAAVPSPTGERFISDLGWKVIVHQARSEALVAVRRQVVSTVAIAVLAAGVVAILGVTIGRRVLAEPLVQLTHIVTQFAAGDLEARARVGSSDEVGLLAASFNRMAEQVSDLLAGLEARTAELEARTREIEASQRVTFAASERTSPDELLNLVVNLMRDQFYLYHVQVYIVDDERQAAVLRQSTGFAGRRLLQSKHQIPLDQPALVTKAILEGEPVVVDDVSAAPDFMPNPLLPDTRSELVVPLRTADRVIGVLDVQDRVVGRFSPNMVPLFQAMADQVTFLFENSDLIERVTEHSRALTIFTDQLRTAADIARQLGGILDPEHLLQQVVDLIRSRFGFYHVHIYTLDETTRRLIVQAGSGEVGRVLRERGHFIPLDAKKSLVARAARNREIVLVEDTTLESDFLPNPLLPQTRSSISLPLIAGDKVLGVLNIQDDQPGRFTQAERDTFGTLAGQIATALQNASLFVQIQARFRVSQALASAQTEDDVLDAMTLVASFSPQARVSIYALDQEVDEFTAILRRDDAFDSGVTSAISIGTRFTALQFPLFQLVSPDEPFISHNLSLDKRVNSADRETVIRQGVVSIAILPITAGTEWLGVLVASSKKEGVFDERRIHLYRSLAEQGATALHAAHLFDETQKAAEELRELDRLKSEFLANMSHELRTPLNSIIGYTEIMLMGIDGEMDPDTFEDVQAIHTNGRHLLRLINDILDLAKIEAGRLVLNFEENYADSLVADASSAVAESLADKPVELIVEVEKDLPPIWGDHMRLDQILNNLVSNAEKFTEEGSITLRAYVDRSSLADDGWICLEVEDTGIGIAKADLDMIFDRFQQVDGSSTRRAGGTGLGLAITQQLVLMHGGVIDVQSEPGKGSTFTVRLPVRRKV